MAETVEHEKDGEVVARVTTFKAEDGSMVRASQAAVPEDDFEGLYWDGEKGNVLCPPYSMLRLRQMGEENNTLDPCVTAYQTNIDGSGYGLVFEGETYDMKSEDIPDNVQAVLDFFAEISPGMSLTTLRKKLRRDLEYTGNGFLEVVRNIDDEIIFVNYIHSHMMRLVRLGPAVPVNFKVMRMGREVTITMQRRERIYAQKIQSKLLYFKEFGASRDVDRDTGEWNKKLPVVKRGNEIIHFTVNPSANGPYGVPRWINQIPSVVGSRQAEEANISYFDSGGVPPVLVFIAGGEMGGTVKQQLINLFNSGAKKGNRGAVVELMPTGGSIDKDSKVDVKVEKFGAEAMNDSMFEGYDDKCDKRVRKSFRLPPLFTGQTDDYNFASAYASYLVAEAQVFGPERFEFDEIWNMTIMRGIDPTGSIRLRSKQISVKDIDTQLKGLGMLKGMDGVSESELVNTINEVTSLSVNHDQALEDKAKQDRQDIITNAAGGNATVQKFEAAGSESFSRIIGLVDDFMSSTGLKSTDREFTKLERGLIEKQVGDLKDQESRLFHALMSARINAGERYDLDGARELVEAAIAESVGQ